MSDPKENSPAAKGRGGPGLVGMILPAVFAAGAAFGGARVAGAHHAPSAPASEQPDPGQPPGPTVALEPFLLTIQDQNKKTHPMKVTLAIEFGASAKEEALKALTPRIRDGTLGYLRTLTFEQAVDPSAGDKMRSELAERLHGTGVPNAERVLITDLVVQ